MEKFENSTLGSLVINHDRASCVSKLGCRRSVRTLKSGIDSPSPLASASCFVSVVLLGTSGQTASPFLQHILLLPGGWLAVVIMCSNPLQACCIITSLITQGMCTG